MPFHPFWIAVVLVIVLIVFGPSRLPELGSAVGKAMREFRKATTELSNEVKVSTEITPEPAPATKVESTSASSSDPKAASSNN
jgi:sec-independent protein translocase protein TatA